MFKQILKYLLLAFIGGGVYMLAEILWYGHTHITMWVLGALCYTIVGYINDEIPWDLEMFWQILIGASVITVLEFFVNVIVNIAFGLGVWSYNELPLNFVGRISLLYSLAWILLAGVGIVLDDYLRYWLFGEEKPHYTFL